MAGMGRNYIVRTVGTADAVMQRSRGMITIRGNLYFDYPLKNQELI